MPIPEATHLQLFVLAALLDGDRSGRDLRDLLAEEDEHRSGPAFYQMMARMEDAGLVEGWYDSKVIDGQHIKERHYRITASGATTFESARQFYLETLRAKNNPEGRLAGA
jgi:DNA-binding PadR family transcriptional regulator